MNEFEVVPVKGEMLGGHYAVQHNSTGRIIGRTFRLDKTQADVLKFELEHVYSHARQEGAK